MAERLGVSVARLEHEITIRELLEWLAVLYGEAVKPKQTRKQMCSILSAYAQACVAAGDLKYGDSRSADTVIRRPE